MKITPAENRRHLGDIINIIQKFRNEHEICGDEYCSCCGNDVKSTILQILKIIKVNIKYTENKTNSLIVYPSWSNSSKNIVNFDYVKSNYNFKKKNYISFQFDVRSNKNKLPDIKEIDDFFKKCKIPFFYIGENSNLNLIEKFEIIASSICYVGCDSGITHLAMMSKTPIFLLSKELDRNRFYPNSNQIKFYNNSKELIKCMQKLKIL